MTYINKLAQQFAELSEKVVNGNSKAKEALTVKHSGTAAMYAAYWLFSTPFTAAAVNLSELAQRMLVLFYSQSLSEKNKSGVHSQSLNTVIAMNYKTHGSDHKQVIASIEALVGAKLLKLEPGNNGELSVTGEFNMAPQFIDAIRNLLPKGPVTYKVKPHGTKVGYAYSKDSVWCKNHKSKQSHCIHHLELMGSIKFRVPESFVVLSENVDLHNYYESTAFEELKQSEFYIPCRYDFRGRTYANSWAVSYQGEPTAKSAVELSSRESYTNRGKFWAEVHLANLLGQDKTTYAERISLVERTDLRSAEAIAMVDPDERALYNQAVRAYESEAQGNPIGAMVSIDATASGPQIIASIFSDPVAGKWVNITASPIREDLYTAVYEAFFKYLGTCPDGITRSNFKGKLIMPTLYGSKMAPVNFFSSELFEGYPWQVKDLCQLYWKVLGEIIPTVTAYTAVLCNMWDTRNNGTQTWTLPDGFVVEYNKRETEEVSVELAPDLWSTFSTTVDKTEGEYISNAANVTHSIDGYVVREMTRRAMRDRSKLILADAMLSASVPADDAVANPTGIMSLLTAYHIAEGKLDPTSITAEDKAKLIATIRKVKDMPYFECVSVHDCFSAHPNYGDFLLQHYRDILCDIARGTLLESIMYSLSGVWHDFAKGDVDTFCENIQKSNYLLC